MGRSTPKTNEAVPVPKDGPLCWLVNTANAKEIAAAQNLVGTKESLDLLSLSKRENDESETAETSPSQILWRILTNSNQIRPQLQALQAYKSKVLHIKRSGEIGAQHDELVGTYKLLLEWGMSHVIPSPLKRAIQSNLGTLESIIDQQEAYRIRAQVTASLFDDDAQQQYWSDPLGTLFEMLNYESTRCITVKESDMSVKCLELLVRESDALQPILDENAFGNNDSPETVTRRAVAAATEKCAFIANTLKLFLTALLSSSSSMTEETMRLAPLMETMQLFLKSGLTCRGMPADELNVIGVVYGQALLFHWKISSQDDSTSSFIANKAADKVFEVTSDEALLPPLNKLAVVQGITATIPNEALVEHSPPIFSDPLATYVLKQCRTATGAAVRLSALRTLHTLINRCVALMSTPLMEEWHLSYVNQLTNDTLEVVLQSWESPPARQVATAVPGLFRSLIALLRKSDGLNGTASSNLNTLVKRILDLPSNRKGKYVALESLLPQVGAKFLNDVAGQELIASLIAGIGEGNHNIVAISDLLGELLSRARVEMNEEAGLVVTTGLSKKERRRLEKIAVLGESDNGRPSEQELPFLPEWVALWCPRLALALVSGSESERKHISTRCIPLLIDIVGGVS